MNALFGSAEHGLSGLVDRPPALAARADRCSPRDAEVRDGAVYAPGVDTSPPRVSELYDGLRFTLRGIVQGVGMRPFIVRLALSEGLRGRVWNDDAGVTIEAFGAPAALASFAGRLRAERPPAARIDALDGEPIRSEPGVSFRAVASAAGTGIPTLSIPPDLATCAACLAEILEPGNRRFHYPFTSCTGCGPRFTIAEAAPYDRVRTTMAGFALCGDCRREYEEPADRRFHAEPNACPVCGPRLSLLSPEGVSLAGGEEALLAAARALREGRVVAVKGLGGFQLACDAGSGEAVARLRARKRREEKPLAVMVRDLAEAGSLAVLSPAERELLASPAAPIVLCRRREPVRRAHERCGPVAAPRIASEVAPDSPLLGLLLPCTPLHHLLLAEAGRPLVMTSGNLSDEPIAFEDADALHRLAGVADLFLLHDRPIAARADDSVARVVGGAPLLLRRARGYVPGAIALGGALAAPVLAAGALLKNAPALGVGARAWLGPHVGDLESAAALDAFEGAVHWLERSLRTRPRLLAHDLHPEYASTRWARARASAEGLAAVAVQHHHAHAVAAMAEHGLAGPVLALVWDGSGLGEDGTAWGGELLLARFEGYERLATFRSLPLAGGDLAVRQPWRLALAALDDAFDGAPPLDRLPLFLRVEESALRVARRMIARGVNTPAAHGAGRLLDAVSAFALGRAHSSFEGQLAVALEAAAAPDEQGAYPVDLDLGRAPWELDPRPLVRGAALDLAAGIAPGLIAARVHRGLARAAAALVRRAAGRGRLPLVLTGGCFANALLVEEVSRQLAPEGFEVFPHRRVPPGDGGLALGQLAVADAVARRS